MRLTLIFLLLGLLGACAPAALAPERPLVFAADYDTLFGATLQAITTSSLPSPAGRLRFTVAEASHDSGVITAVHGARYSSVATASKTFGDPASGASFGVRLALPLSEPQPEVLLSLVLRPEGEGRASLVFASVDHRGRESVTGNRFMARVLEALSARFGPPLE